MITIRKERIAALLTVCTLLCGCGSDKTVSAAVTTTAAGTDSESDAPVGYSFTKISREEFLDATADVDYAGDWVYDTGCGEEQYALFYGKMIARFGEPDDASDDWENMYSYYIKADNGSDALYFMIYQGAGGSGIAIPTKSDTGYDAARGELLTYVESADPADYTWEGEYSDIPLKVTYTVKDGKAEVHSEFPDNMSLTDYLNLL